jgi:hypothetical protein
MTDCRHQFDGNATFTVAANSPTNAPLAGAIVNGTFKAGPGDLVLQIALSSTAPITLNLHGARIQATSITADGMTAIVGGAVLADELNSSILPAIEAQLPPILARDCGHTGAGVDRCGCDSGSTGAEIITLLDTAPMDCMIEPKEVTSNGVISTVLMPDICSKDSCTTPDEVSIGIQIHAVKATF